MMKYSEIYKLIQSGNDLKSLRKLHLANKLPLNESFLINLDRKELTTILKAVTTKKERKENKIKLTSKYDDLFLNLVFLQDFKIENKTTPYNELLKEVKKLGLKVSNLKKRNRSILEEYLNIKNDQTELSLFKEKYYKTIGISLEAKYFRVDKFSKIIPDNTLFYFTKYPQKKFRLTIIQENKVRFESKIDKNNKSVDMEEAVQLIASREYKILKVLNAVQVLKEYSSIIKDDIVITEIFKSDINDFLQKRLVDQYNVFVDYKFSQTDVLPKYESLLKVPHKKSSAPKLNIFDEDGNLICNDDYNTNQDMCGLDILHEYTFPKKTIDFIANYVNEKYYEFYPESDLGYDCRTDGISIDTLGCIFQLNRQNCRIADVNSKMFYNMNCTNPDKHKKCAMLISNNAHFYDITSNIIRESLRNTRNTIHTKYIKEKNDNEKNKKSESIHYFVYNIDYEIELYETIWNTTIESKDIDENDSRDLEAENYLQKINDETIAGYFTELNKLKDLVKRTNYDEKRITFLESSIQHLQNYQDDKFVVVLPEKVVDKRTLEIKRVQEIIDKSKYNEVQKTIELYVRDQQQILEFYHTSYSKGKIYKCKFISSKIVEIVVNPTLIIKYNEDYNSIVELCGQLNIPFDNQSYIMFAYEFLEKISKNNILKILKSDFNAETLKFVNTTVSSSCVENFNKINDYKACTAIDINKNFSSVLEDENMKYVVFKVFDEVVVYDYSKISDDCVYYIEPSDFNYLIYRSGVYFSNIVKQALDDELISIHDIKYYVKARIVSTKIFNTFVNFTFNSCGKFAKNIVNHFLGSLGKRTRVKGKCIYSSDLNTIATILFNDAKNTKYIHKIRDNLYMINDTVDLDNNKNLFMIRNQVVQEASLRTYRLYKMMGGKLICIKTDCVVVENQKHKVKFSDIRGEYKPEKVSTCRTLRVTNTVDLSTTYNLTEYKLNPIQIIDEYDFNEIWRKIKYNHCFITGLAGSGKTYVSRKLIQKYTEEGKNVKSMAYTNIACKNLENSVTLHNGLGFDINFEKSAINFYDDVDVILIDEISMVPSNFYSELAIIKREYPKIIFIGVGDFTQLPPIQEERLFIKDNVAFTSIFENVIEFKINKRCEEDGMVMFQTITNIINHVKIDLKKSDELFKLNLCYTNKKRVQVNKLLMEKFKPEKYMNLTIADCLKLAFRDIDDENKPESKPKKPRKSSVKKIEQEFKVFDISSDDLQVVDVEAEKIQREDESIAEFIFYSQDFIIYVGLPIRSRKTFRNLPIVNGDNLIVKSFDSTGIEVSVDNSRFTLDKEIPTIFIPFNKYFCYWFNPNYAMTIHNSQCQSFKENYTLWEIQKYGRLGAIRNEKNYIKTEGTYALNVAVSRARNISFVHERQTDIPYPVSKIKDEDEDEDNGVFVTKCKSNFRSNMSSGEKFIFEYLEKCKDVTSFETEKVFKDLKDNKYLRFDFFITLRNNSLLIIEFDGEQHVLPAFGKGKTGLLQIQTRDNIKNKYCKTSSLPIIRLTKKDLTKDKLNRLINAVSPACYDSKKGLFPI